MFIILIAVMVSHMCVCVSKFQQVIHFKYVQFIVYQLCLNKAIKNFKKGKTLTLLHVSVQSVASIGSTLNSVHLAVEAIQKTVDEHKKTLELLQSDMVRKSTNATESQHTPACPFLCYRVILTSHLPKQTTLGTFLKYTIDSVY